jgi:hypothetical protein
MDGCFSVFGDKVHLFATAPGHFEHDLRISLLREDLRRPHPLLPIPQSNTLLILNYLDLSPRRKCEKDEEGDDWRQDEGGDKEQDVIIIEVAG